MILQTLFCPRDRVMIEGGAYFCMKQDAGSADPEEACGILFGSRGTGIVQGSRTLANGAGRNESRRHYRIDPLAILSAEDEKNMIPGMIYLIFPVSGGRTGRGRAYEKSAADGTVKEIHITLKESRPS